MIEHCGGRRQRRPKLDLGCSTTEWMELFHALLVKITLSMYVFSFCNDVPPVLMKYIRQNTSKLLTYFVKPKFSRHIKYALETMTQKAQLTKSGN
jgi:hypothetical protein